MMRPPLIPLIAVVIIGALAAVGYWFGGRSGATDPDANLTNLSVESGECEVYPAGCAAHGPGLELKLRFLDQPSALLPTAIELSSSAPLSSAAVDFEMVSMNMGLNRYRLEPDNTGMYRAQVMLPVCASGRRDWIARVRAVSDGRSYLAEFPFEVQR